MKSRLFALICVLFLLCTFVFVACNQGKEPPEELPDSEYFVFEDDSDTPVVKDLVLSSKQAEIIKRAYVKYREEKNIPVEFDEVEINFCLGRVGNIPIVSFKNDVLLKSSMYPNLIGNVWINCYYGRPMYVYQEGKLERFTDISGYIDSFAREIFTEETLLAILNKFWDELPSFNWECHDKVTPVELTDEQIAELEDARRELLGYGASYLKLDKCYGELNGKLILFFNIDDPNESPLMPIPQPIFWDDVPFASYYNWQVYVDGQFCRYDIAYQDGIITRSELIAISLAVNNATDMQELFLRDATFIPW